MDNNATTQLEAPEVTSAVNSCLSMGFSGFTSMNKMWLDSILKQLLDPPTNRLLCSIFPTTIG
jgi:hypothetical protein